MCMHLHTRTRITDAHCTSACCAHTCISYAPDADVDADVDADMRVCVSFPRVCLHAFVGASAPACLRSCMHAGAPPTASAPLRVYVFAACLFLCCSCSLSQCASDVLCYFRFSIVRSVQRMGHMPHAPYHMHHATCTKPHAKCNICASHEHIRYLK
jgi:hypothetical protein